LLFSRSNGGEVAAGGVYVLILGGGGASYVFYEITERKKEVKMGGKARVIVTVGNRSVYRGNRPYRPGPVTVPAGYQPLGLGIFEFEFQKLKIMGKIPKKTS
jgi:hypothetical protein